MLVAGHTRAALIAAAIAVLIIGPSVDLRSSLVYILIAGLTWPLIAFSIGLYRGDQLTAWASAISEVPRAIVAVILITWPLYQIGTASCRVRVEISVVAA